MTKAEIEYWANRVIETALRGQPNEDDHVELKSEETDTHQAARRVAGLANAARGEPVLWFHGLDEKKHEIAPSTIDPAKWWPSVRKHFADDHAPEPRIVVVRHDKGNVLVFYFETDGAPYVITNLKPTPDKAEREVPFRAHTGLRSAKHGDLIDLLVPASKAMRFEEIHAELYIVDGPGAVGRQWAIRFLAYAIPPTADRYYILQHRCSVEVAIESPHWRVTFDDVKLESKVHSVGETELVIVQPGPLALTAHTRVASSPSSFEGSTANVTAKIGATPGPARGISVTSMLDYRRVTIGFNTHFSPSPPSARWATVGQSIDSYLKKVKLETP